MGGAAVWSTAWLELVKSVRGSSATSHHAPNFKSQQPIDIIDVGHQVGGHSFDTISLVGIRVTINEDILGFFKSLCERFYQSYGGWFTRDCPEMVVEVERAITAEGLTAYDRVLGSIPVMEGVYPLAANGHNIRRIIANEEAVMSDLGPILATPNLPEQLAIVIVAGNSD